MTIHWTNLTPGERDAIIAEFVMGWNLNVKKYSYIGSHGLYWPNPGKPAHAWKPTESIADAWLVVEKMQDVGFGVGIFAVPGYSSIMHGWLVVFGGGVYPINPRELSKHHHASAETVQESVCIAALRAKGIEVEL
jgi:hypothetical protein